MMKTETESSDCSPRLQHKRAGFTLVELLVVMAIIAVLMGIVLSISGGVTQGAAENQARAEIADLELELEKYNQAKGEYPENLGELVTWYETEQYPDTRFDLTELDGDDRPLDPWGRRYEYGRRNDYVFVLSSEGIDGRSGTEDDIRN